MQRNKVELTIVILSLALQACNLALLIQLWNVVANLDIALPPSPGAPSKTDLNIGYILYIITSSSISAFLYLYFLVLAIFKKNPCMKVNWFFYLVIVFLQFGTGVVYSVFMMNNKAVFDAAERIYIMAIGSDINTPQVGYYGQTIFLKKLILALTILNFVVCFVGSIVLFARYTFPSTNQDQDKRDREQIKKAQVTVTQM